MANSGDMQIELIQQRCGTPSMYRDFLQSSGEGLQHWAAWPQPLRRRIIEQIRDAAASWDGTNPIRRS
jgi:hypothetical protein